MTKHQKARVKAKAAAARNVSIWAPTQPCPDCGAQMQQKAYLSANEPTTTVDRDGSCGSLELWQCPACKNVEWGVWS